MFSQKEAEQCLADLEFAFQQSHKNKVADSHRSLVRPIIEDCHYPTLTQRANTNLYRVRQGDTNNLFDDSHFFYNVKEFHVNPDPTKIRRGRCNHERSQVFYCAFEERTAQYEALEPFRKADNDDVRVPHIAYIGRWITNRELILANFSGAVDFESFFQANHPEWSDFVRRLELFFRYLFSLPSNGNPAVYSLTATISEMLLKKFDGVAYPSSCTNGTGASLALNPSLVADDSLTFHNAARVRRTEYKGDSSRIDNWIGMVTDDDGSLLWMPSGERILESLREDGIAYVPYAYEDPK